MNIKPIKSVFAVRAAVMLFTVLATTGAWAQAQLNEDFEGSTFAPEDWMAIHVSGDKSWERMPNDRDKGGFGAYMTYSKDGSENYLITPQLLPAKKNGTSFNEQLIFKVAAQQYTGTTLRIEVSTTDTKPSSFTPIKTYTTGSSQGISTNIGSTMLNQWREKYVGIPDKYIGKPIYIAFHVIDHNGSTIVIDDVYGVSLYISPYAKPTNLSCSYVTINSVDLSWSAGDSETAWQVQVVCLNSGDEIYNKTLTTKSFTLGGLTPGSDYSVKVRGKYGDDQYSNWSSISFSTLPLELSDASDNSDYLMLYNGKTVDVTLTGRTLFKDGSWNTLCLPFNLTLNGSILDGDNVQLMTLDDASFSDGTLALTFQTAQNIQAGVPYIIKWSDTGSHIVNPMFRDVTIVNESNDVTNSVVSFKGNYSPYEIKGESKKLLYLGADGKQLYYPNADMTINAFRAYFELQGDLECGEPSSPRGINNFVLNFGGDGTGIEHLQSPIFNILSESWFTLDGRKLNDKPTQKGIYIHNGQKIVIK